MCERTLILNADVYSSGAVKRNFGLFINENGRVADVFSMDDYRQSKYGDACAEIRAKGLTVSPGLIDTHIHGIGGFATDDGSSSSILSMSERLAEFGVTSFLPTLYAGRPEKMEKEILAVVNAMGKETGARILGMHLEGPFLNPAKCGAQDSMALSAPDESVFERLIKAGQGKITAMTIAPELNNVDKIARIAKKKGIVLLMGHTDATYEEAKAGTDLGIFHATHMFNAMSPMNHKKPGVAGHVLFDERMHCEVIADGVHVHKDVLKHLIKTKAQDKVVLITDSLAPASLGEGSFVANGTNVVLGSAGAFFSQENPSLLCGSALTLNRAVANVQRWCTDRAQAIRMATENPAKLYGFEGIGTIAKGTWADIALFDENMEPAMVFIGGKRVFSR